jgi:hypothetical protein
VRDPIDEWAQPLRLDAVVDETALATFGDETGLTKYREMLGHGRLRNAGAGDEVSDRRFALRQPLENRSAARVGQGAEDTVLGQHSGLISRDLLIVKRAARSAGARASFLQFGLAKASIEDIAKRANISRHRGGCPEQIFRGPASFGTRIQVLVEHFI